MRCPLLVFRISFISFTKPHLSCWTNYNKSFVIIMPVGRQYIYVNYCFNNFVYQAMLLSDATTPQCASAPLKLFRFPCTSLWVLIKFCNEFKGLLIGFGLTFAQNFKIIQSLFLNFYGVAPHKLRMYWSSSSTLENCLPDCFFALSIRAKNSSLVKSVESSFSETSLRRYFAARFSWVSSSAMMLILRRISAFNCMAVITLYLSFTAPSRPDSCP